MNVEVLGQQAYFGLVTGAVYVLFASGLTLLFGVMRVVNMAHGEIAMLGAMFTYSLMANFDLAFAFAVPLAVVAVGAFGLVISRVAIQPLQGSSMLMPLLSTFGVSMVLLHGSVRIWDATPRQLPGAPFDGISRPGGVAVSHQSLMVLVVTAAAMAGLYLLTTRTQLGRMMRAVQQNRRGAEVIGLNTKRVYDSTVIIASALAALGGIFMLPIQPYHPNMGQSLLLFGFAIVIVAGMGNVVGAAVVGVSVGVSEALFGQYVSTYYRQAFVFSLMLIVLLVRPQGLFGRK